MDMIKENLTQRDTDFCDTEESVVLARTWLQSGAITVKQFYSEMKQGIHKKGLHGTEALPDSCRSILTL